MFITTTIAMAQSESNCEEEVTSTANSRSDETSETEAKHKITIYYGFKLSKDANVNFVFPGGTIEYTINYTNPSNRTLNDVEIIDELHNQTEFDPDDVQWSISGPNQVKRTIGQLKPGNHSVNLIVRVKEDTTPGTIIRNSCTIRYERAENSAKHDAIVISHLPPVKYPMPSSMWEPEFERQILSYETTEWQPRPQYRYDVIVAIVAFGLGFCLSRLDGTIPAETVDEFSTWPPATPECWTACAEDGEPPYNRPQLPDRRIPIEEWEEQNWARWYPTPRIKTTIISEERPSKAAYGSYIAFAVGFDFTVRALWKRFGKHKFPERGWKILP